MLYLRNINLLQNLKFEVNLILSIIIKTRWRSAASSSISELLESKPRERLFVLVLVLVKVLVVVHVLVHNIRNVLNILEIVLERYLEF